MHFGPKDQILLSDLPGKERTGKVSCPFRLRTCARRDSNPHHLDFNDKPALSARKAISVVNLSGVGAQGASALAGLYLNYKSFDLEGLEPSLPHF